MAVFSGFDTVRQHKPGLPARLEALSLATAPARPGGLRVLSEADAAAYRLAFERQRAGDYAGADEELRRVRATLLRGTLLAERYMNGGPASYAELSDWLVRYGKLPQAAEIHALALTRRPQGAAAPAQPEKARMLRGVSNGQHKSVLRDDRRWRQGLASYRGGRMSDAAATFAALAERKDLTAPEDRAAAHFWAHRAFKGAGDRASARRHAQLAAREAPGFYSLLARHAVHGRMALAAASAPDEEELRPLLRVPAIERAVALTEVGQDALAEKELRARFPVADNDQRGQLVTLAKLLNLPAAQMRMAAAYTGRAEEDDAYYPMPDWQPASGYRLDPALLFAIMRQESGFDMHARSAAGATGLMQLMPSTASAMSKGIGGQSHDPAVNMALGQNYLEHLMQTPEIGTNLVLLTAAYNAGPGRVSSWRRGAHREEDPLLFVESLPYPQTRAYVTHVLGNYWVYSALLGTQDDASLAAIAGGQWPRYEGAEQQLMSLLSKSQ